MLNPTGNFDSWGQLQPGRVGDPLLAALVGPDSAL